MFFIFHVRYKFLLFTNFNTVGKKLDVKSFSETFLELGHVLAITRKLVFAMSNGGTFEKPGFLADIARKLDLISKSLLMPILCIGESGDEKQQNKTEQILEQQIIHALSASEKLHNLIIAYEPVWAIGSGSSAEPKEINSIHKLIKDIVQSRFSNLNLQAVIYGGSVSIENSSSILREKEVDGALVGGASLDGGEFAKIANIFNELKEL